MNRILAIATNLFPVWVLAGGALALAQPGWFKWFSGGFITWGLAGSWRLRPVKSAQNSPACEGGATPLV